MTKAERESLIRTMSAWRDHGVAPDEKNIIRVTDAGTTVEWLAFNEYKTYYRISNEGFVDISSKEGIQIAIDRVEAWVAEWAMLILAEE